MQKKDELLGSNPSILRQTTKEELFEYVRQAREAQKIWAEIPYRRKKEHILRIRDYIRDQAERIAETISRDNGKTLVDAMATEVVPAAIAADYYAKNTHRFLKPKKLHSSAWILSYKRSILYRRPFGVIGIISPWNYPFSIPFSEVIMALLAGNAVVLKTASETPEVGSVLKECMQAGEFPVPIFHHVFMKGSMAGPAFFEAGIDKLFFTGSTATGKVIMKLASETLTPLSLELGGKDPMIILPDADIKRAARGAVWAGMQNAGQSCGGVERIYVHRDIYQAFLNELKKEVEALRVNKGTDFQADIGEITTEKQWETIRTHVEEALQMGAKPYAQAHIPASDKGLFYPPLILTDVTHEMKVMREETFGPVIGVMPFSTIEEAIALANDSSMGLTASIWTRNRRLARKLAGRLEAGAVTINDHLMSHGLPETPWGGFKESGIGRTHAFLGVEEMTQPQVVVDDWLSFLKRQLWWHPFSEEVYRGLRNLLYLLYGNLAHKIRSIPSVLKLLPRLFR